MHIQFWTYNLVSNVPHLHARNRWAAPTSVHVVGFNKQSYIWWQQLVQASVIVCACVNSCDIIQKKYYTVEDIV